MTAAPIELHPAETIPQSQKTNGASRASTPGPSYRSTDYGNAERLIARHGDDLLYHRGQWYVWDGTRFRMDGTGEIERRAKDTVRSIYDEAAVAGDSDDRKRLAKHASDSEARARLTAMVSLAASELPVVVEDTDSLDADPWLLNCTNGTVDLRTGELREHARTDRITRTTGITADLDAACPTWDTFLESILPDPGVREFIQRVVGYTLTGATVEEKMFILNGGGANGKSTLIDTVMLVLGEYAMRAPPDLMIAKRDNGIGNDVAALRGSRLASAVETEDGARLNEVRTKELVTGDPQSARYLHKEFFTFKPIAKYWIATNHRPVVKGSDEAIWRRMVLIPFSQYIPPAQRDKYLADKLRAESAGILAWAVRGCLAWQQHGLTEPDAIRAATSHYRAEQDLIGGFLETECVVHPDAHASASSLYQAYRTWCESAGEYPQTQRRFGQRLSERDGLSKAKTGHQNTVTWYGVGLRTAWQHLAEHQDRAAEAAEQEEQPPAPAELSAAPELSVPPPAEGPCSACASSGEWCGFGHVAAEGQEQPCVVCAALTLVRSQCGTPRTAYCSPGGDGGTQGPEPSPSGAHAPRSRRLRPVPDPPHDDTPSEAEGRTPATEEEEREHFARAVRERYPDATDADLAAALGVWHEVTDGTRFVSFPGETGIAAYSRLVARHGSMPLPQSPQDCSEIVTEMSGRLTMFRDHLTPGLSFPEGTNITGVDVCAQFIAAARSVELGDGDPDVVTAPRSLESLLNFPGYVELARAVNTKHPAFGKLAKGAVLTTDTAKYLVKNRALALQAARVVVWRKHGRRLKTWATLFGGAYQSLQGKTDPASVYALAAVKAVYTAFLGGMLRSDRYNKSLLLRPDWSDQLVTLAGANMLRALDKAANAGHTPVGVWRDAAWFASTEPEPLAVPGLEFRAQPGKWKIDRFAALTEDMRAAYDEGSPAKFRDGLIAAIDEQGQG